MRNRLIGVLGLVFLGSGFASAQNSDLGILLGVSVRTSGVVTPTVVEGSVTASGQINYAIQLREAKVALLYLELPLLITDSERSVVTQSVISSHNTTVFFTPGVRLHYTIHPRIAIYGSVGGGLAVLESKMSLVAPNLISDTNGSDVTAALGLGAGIDFRLTRLLSLRAEGRDFITRAGLGGETGHSHAFFTVGVGFHF